MAYKESKVSVFGKSKVGDHSHIFLGVWLMLLSAHVSLVPCCSLVSVIADSSSTWWTWQ